ncbi:MAG: GDP-mannose 4,6-dehydratase, partial [Vicingaceae bacterium]
MKVVITGVLGFVGVNLALACITKGYKVIGFDNRFKTLGSQENLQLFLEHGGEYHHVDIRNNNDVETFFKNINEIDVIYNMAAQVAFKNSIENPRLDFEINALGTLNILESLRLYHSNAIFVNASTNQVYGNASSVELVEQKSIFDFKNLNFGISEDFPMDFLSPYGCSKGAADLYTIDYA